MFDHHLFSVAELRSLVFSHSKPSTLAACARVCKDWTDSSLDVLWESVDLCDLLHILAPFSKLTEDVHGKAIYKFTRMTTPQDWDRFALYATRVRRISYDLKAVSKHRRLHETVFHEFGRARPPHDLFLKLRSLKWVDSESQTWSWCIMFMHKRVQKFKYYPPQDPKFDFLPLAQNIVLRMPDLLRLDFCSQIHSPNLETSLLRLICGLPKLKVLLVPLFYVTSAVFEELSRLQDLETIGSHRQGHGDARNVLTFKPAFAPSSLLSLTSLNIAAHLPDLDIMFHDEAILPALECLDLREVTGSTPEQLEHLLATLVEKYPGLRSLVVFLRAPCKTRLATPTTERVSLRHLTSVFDFHSLDIFFIYHDYPLAIDEDGMELLASRLPYIRRLALNPSPRFSSVTPPITFTALESFAHWCPHLVDLGVCVDATDIPSPSLPTTQFRTLKQLCMGLSHGPFIQETAIFLSRLCPPGCDIVNTLELNEGIYWTESEELRCARKRWSHWESVGKTLKPLISTREEERAKVRAMESQLNQLRDLVRRSAADGRIDPILLAEAFPDDSLSESIHSTSSPVDQV
ncbi:hypothetical protein JAAARDRAFT_42577 [Jaapia argillacea MUCL 33604]|uniref:F-box domain-containing protein n=1 Tax=Jaapia argillacea MUCL 33604 TaxID=933084 RepID=A0A067PGZ3_9AGAM|nr:hypothetical protein JAAARDRAFT_42577 [Jaapia argillacea MUCL 33604]